MSDFIDKQHNENNSLYFNNLYQTKSILQLLYGYLTISLSLHKTAIEIVENGLQKIVRKLLDKCLEILIQIN